MNYDHPELLDRLAAAFTFGSLSRLARRRFARLRHELPAADAAARQWEAHSAALALSVPPVQPSRRLWEAIERRTGGATVVRPQPQSMWVRWLRPTLGFAFGLLLATGVLRLHPELVLPAAQQNEALPESYVGLLVDAQGTPALLASATRHGRRMNIKMLRPLEVPPGKALHLWALPQEGAAFVLGRVPPSGKASFEMSATSEQLLSRVSRLGVTVDDAAAAPDRPSAFVLTGHCVKLW